MAGSDFALEHAAVWAAIDDLAVQVGLSVGMLATAAGLDPGTLSLSKRFDKRGRPRWPSTETVTAVLRATDTTFQEFGMLVDAIRYAMAREANRALSDEARRNVRDQSAA